MKKSVLLGILSAIGLAAIVTGIVFTQSGSAPANEPSRSQSTDSNDSASNADSSTSTAGSANESVDSVKAVVIVYTDAGFEKDTYAATSGQTVIVKNQSSARLEFSSDNHPSHTDNSELNLAAIVPGGEAAFRPSRTGTWGIHDHRQADHAAELVVSD